MNELIAELRRLAPNRAVSYGEALQIGRLQATHVRRWVEAESPDMNLIWLAKQRAVPVNFVHSHFLGEESGMTTNELSSKLEVYINQEEPQVRQRFSLLHEFKHVLDFYDADTLYAKLGWGDQDRQNILVEAIASDFAAHVLMPTGVVKRLWYETQNIPQMAKAFNVSVEAMGWRLDKLNLIGGTKPRSQTYFRRASDFLPSNEADELSFTT